MEEAFSKKYHIILASQSPRRKQLLQEMGIRFELRTHKEIEEIYPEVLTNQEIVLYLSKLKFNSYEKTLGNNELIITADTIVCLDNQVLGKPNDRAEAVAMLTKLSDNCHVVYTGITVGSKKKVVSAFDKTEVYFSKLTKENIEWYVDTFKPFDKAGSYGIQEWIGYVGIEKIVGSFYNVMGLPTHTLYSVLKQFE